MQRVRAVRGVAAISAVFFLIFLAACGGSGTTANKPTQVVLSPTTLSLNEGAVVGLSATAEDSSGNSVAADIAFTSSNNNIATVSTGGLVCGGVWDNLSTPVNCNATIGQGGVGQVTITATATAFGISTTATVYVHLQVDQVVTLLNSGCPNGQPSACTTMSQPITICAEAFSTTAPGCSPSAPCDITSTVGPFSFGSNDLLVAASSSGIEPTYSSASKTPTYTSGGTISGSKGQTCDLSDFNGVIGATATVPLTGSNTIASGTQLTITNSGHGASLPPTSATLSNGTATCSGVAVVQTALTPGTFSAETPGMTTVFASVSGVNSVGVPYLTCPVQSIMVHDANGSGTSFTIAPQGTQALTADVIDMNNQPITPDINWASSSTAVANVAIGTTGNNPATVTGVAGGTAYITASCSAPNCNRGVPAQYGQNVVTMNVTSPAATTVYAASTNSAEVIPINTSNNTAGNPIGLPFGPNSIVASPSGSMVYLGSGTALMAVTVSSGAVTPYTAAPGTVIAISNDGSFLLLSNSANNSLMYFNTTNGAITGTAAGTTASSAYTPDSLTNDSVLAPPNDNQLEFGSQAGPLGTVMLPSAGIGLDISGSGALNYITSSNGRAVYLYSTCDVSQTPMTLPATSPTLVKALPNATGAVVADSPDIDVISTPAVLNAGCPITALSSINGYNLNAGSFTAQQMLVSSDATHAYIISNLPQVLSFDIPTLTPGSAALAGGATAFNGGITVDGSRIYVGASDGMVHEIDTASMTDAAQIAVGLKDPNGNPVMPNLVTVVP